jgi:hypothetical protein
MTGYTVHTGASKKFVSGWDRVFGSDTNGSESKGTKASKTKSAAAKKKKSKKK